MWTLDSLDIRSLSHHNPFQIVSLGSPNWESQAESQARQQSSKPRRKRRCTMLHRWSQSPTAARTEPWDPWDPWDSGKKSSFTMSHTICKFADPSRGPLASESQTNEDQALDTHAVFCLLTKLSFWSGSCETSGLSAPSARRSWCIN